MSIRRVVALTLIIMFACSLPAWADDVYDYFKAKKIIVTVNGIQSEEAGLLTDQGKVLLPLRDIAGTLQAIVKWDNKKQEVNIFKPNVHVFPISQVNDEIVPFANVFKGKNDFYLWTQVDSLQTEINAIKLAITDPDNEKVYEYVVEYTKDRPSQEEFWLTTRQISLNFKQHGKYTIHVLMQTEKDGEFDLVAQRVIRCIPDRTK